jgi:hypothetical protein
VSFFDERFLERYQSNFEDFAKVPDALRYTDIFNKAKINKINYVIEPLVK